MERLKDLVGSHKKSTWVELWMLSVVYYIFKLSTIPDPPSCWNAFCQAVHLPTLELLNNEKHLNFLPYPFSPEATPLVSNGSFIPMKHYVPFLFCLVPKWLHHVCPTLFDHLTELAALVHFNLHDSH